MPNNISKKRHIMNCFGESKGFNRIIPNEGHVRLNDDEFYYMKAETNVYKRYTIDDGHYAERLPRFNNCSLWMKDFSDWNLCGAIFVNCEFLRCDFTGRYGMEFFNCRFHDCDTLEAAANLFFNCAFDEESVPKE